MNRLDRIREAAEKDKALRFTSLMHHITEGLLRTAYMALNRTAAVGVDDVTWREYGEKLNDHLPDLHERVQSGRYRALPSKRIWIPKPDGRQRPIGIAALEDKIVQQAVVMVLNQIFEADFLGFSYGFRPGRNPHNALDAVWVGIERRKVNWVLDADIKGFFDAISHEWTLKFLEHRIADQRLLRLCRKWLRAGVSEAGQWSKTEVGTPQGGVVSPLLANLFLHYAFDKWISREYPDVPFERYADDAVCHCRTQAQAERLKHELEARMKEVGLELHPEKTKIVYCKDDDRQKDYSQVSFDFLGYTFRARRSKNRWGKYFVNFSPAISNKAAKAIRHKSRGWNWSLRSDKQLEDLALMFNPIIKGWINYYGRYYKSALYPTLQCLERRLILWATRKYKRLRNHRRRAAQWLNRIARKQPNLFAHWRLMYATAGR